MAAATLDHFPPDTKVQVWTKTGDSFDGGGRGKKVEDGIQVGTDGSLVLTGLDEDKEYWCVGDNGRVVDFIAADPDPRSGKTGRKRQPKGRAAQPTAGKGKRAASTGGPDKVKRPSGGAQVLSATQQGGSGRSTTAHDDRLTGRPGKATQKPPRAKSSAKKAAKKAPAKKASRVKKGAKGVRGARGSRNTR